jgi:hypothetical protein
VAAQGDHATLQQNSDVRVRAIFVEDMSGPVLRMLGGKQVHLSYLPAAR